MAKSTKKSIKKSSKSDAVKKVKGERTEAIDKATKKKGKKLKEAKATKPEKKQKKSKVEKTEKAGKSKKGKATATKTKRAKKPTPVFAPIKQKQNRSQQLDDLIERADLGAVVPKAELSERDEKKIVKAVMAALEAQICGHITKGGSGQFQFPGLFKVVTKHVPAKPKRKGINPFTKEEQIFAAKPATTKVRARPMKKLKDIAAGV